MARTYYYVFGKCQQALTQLHCTVSILIAICTCLMLYAYSPSHPCMHSLRLWCWPDFFHILNWKPATTAGRNREWKKHEQQSMYAHTLPYDSILKLSVSIPQALLLGAQGTYGNTTKSFSRSCSHVQPATMYILPLTLTFQSLCSPQTASHLVDHRLHQSSLPVNNRHTMKTQDDYNTSFNHVGGHVVILLSLAYKR